MVEEHQFEIPLLWVGVEDTPAITSNRFLSQFEADQFFVSFGQVAPPVVIGTPEEQLQQIERLGYVPIKTVARVALTPQRMRELILVLEMNLENYERMHGGEE